MKFNLMRNFVLFIITAKYKYRIRLARPHLDKEHVSSRSYWISRRVYSLHFRQMEREFVLSGKYSIFRDITNWYLYPSHCRP